MSEILANCTITSISNNVLVHSVTVVHNQNYNVMLCHEKLSN